MPYCVRYRSFDLSERGDGRFDLEVVVDGYMPLVRRMLESFRLCARVEEVIEHEGTFGSVAPNYSGEPRKRVYRLNGVRDAKAASNSLLLFKNRIAIDLMPNIDECYALGPYSLKDSEDADWAKAEYGEMSSSAKFDSDAKAIEWAGKELTDIARCLSAWQGIDVVSAPPKSRDEYQDVSWTWAEAVASSLAAPVVRTSKSRRTPPQMPDYGTDEEAGSEDEQERVGRIGDSMQVSESLEGQRVLVVDNTVRSGGTLVEAGRALKDAGATKVYGLSLAKNAKYTKGGMSLLRGDWL